MFWFISLALLKKMSELCACDSICICITCLGQICFLTDPTISPFLLPSLSNRWFQYTGATPASSEPSCWMVLLSLPLPTKTHRGKGQVHPSVRVGCSCLWCFHSLIFQGPLFCLSLLGQRMNSFDSTRSWIAREEGWGLLTEDQNGLKCCELLLCSLPPYIKAMPSLFVFREKKQTNKQKLENKTKQYWQPQNERTINAVYKTGVVRP